MMLFRAILAAICWLFCRAMLLCLDRLAHMGQYAWYEKRAAVHWRTIERVLRGEA